MFNGTDSPPSRKLNRHDRLKLEAYNRDRDDVLRRLDLIALNNHFDKWKLPKPKSWIGEAPFIMMHKSRLQLSTFSDAEKMQSREWLHSHGYGTRDRHGDNEPFIVKFNGMGHTANEPPNPDFPEGIFIDGSRGAFWTCVVQLPYPAPQVGQFHIGCKLCGRTVLATAAGRADDPRYVRLACKDKQPVLPKDMPDMMAGVKAEEEPK